MTGDRPNKLIARQDEGARDRRGTHGPDFRSATARLIEGILMPLVHCGRTYPAEGNRCAQVDALRPVGMAWNARRR